MVYAGEVDEGMRRLDEAATAAVAGDLHDLDAIGTICCYLIMACERVQDYSRAAQWCDMVKQVSARWSIVSSSRCARLTTRASSWDAGSGTRRNRYCWTRSPICKESSPAMATDGLARLLAELRRRQGRRDEAEALFKQADGHPLRWLSREYVLLGQASLALDRSDPLRALDLTDRFMRSLGPADRVEHASGLAMLARAKAALGPGAALECEAVFALDVIEPQVGSPMTVGAARYAQECWR